MIYSDWEREGGVDALTRGILEAMPGGVVHVRADGAIRAANADALRILGMSYDEATDRYTQDWAPDTFYEDGRPCPADEYPVSRALTMGEAQPGVTLGILRPDGEVVWAVFRAAPIRDPVTDDVTGAIATFIDISDRKQAEAAVLESERLVRRSESRLQDILDSSLDGVITIDRKGIIRTFNPAAERLFGYNADEAAGQPVAMLMTGPDRGAHDAYIERYQSTGVEAIIGTERELEGLRKDGTRVPIALRITELRGDDTGYLASVQDVTARQAARQERESFAQRRRQSEKLEAVGTLAGGIAHDFNNLLVPILAYADLLGDWDGDPERRAEMIREIRTAAVRGKRLVEQILSLSRQEEAAPRPVGVRETVDEIVRLLSPSLPAGVDLRTISGPAPFALGSASKIHQVVLNICVNAIQATEPFGGTVEIEVNHSQGTRWRRRLPAELAAGGPYVVVRVLDTGVGIAAEDLPHIFEPFFSTKEAGQGTGLGLATVHGIVKSQGGAVTVDSTLGEGSAFTVFLPLCVDEVADRNEQPAPVVPQSGKGRLLVVDDDPAVLKVSCLTLQAAGYSVHPYAIATNALQAFRSAPGDFDLAVLDHSMPVMSGLSLAGELRQTRADLPVVLCTGHISDEVLAEAQLLDALTHVAKPYAPEDLAGAIAELLER